MASFVYFIGSVNPNSNSLEAIKIGKSIDRRKRMLELQTSNANDLVLINVIECKTEVDALELEKGYHEKYRTSRMNGEWFGVSANLLSDIYVFDIEVANISEDLKLIDARKTELRGEILSILEEAGEIGLSAGDIIGKTDKKDGTIRSMLRRMFRDGDIKQLQHRGTYIHPGFFHEG